MPLARGKLAIAPDGCNGSYKTNYKFINDPLYTIEPIVNFSYIKQATLKSGM